MFRSILVPLDGSPEAEQALALACRIADRARADLRIARVHVPLAALEGGAAFTEIELDAACRDEERFYLESMVETLHKRTAATVSSVFAEGPVVGVLEETVRGVGADLVVMTTHGRGAFARFWLGGVADALVRRVAAPVLLVKPGENVERAEIEHVLVALDGSTLAEEILEPAQALASLVGAELTLLRVVRPLLASDFGRATGPLRKQGEAWLAQARDAHEQARGEAQAYLEGVAVRVGAGLRVTTRVISADNPATAILQTAAERPDGLIALSTNGRGGLRRLMLGSVADKIIRGSTCPVLVQRPVHAEAAKPG